jgi:hypothetical protein
LDERSRDKKILGINEKWAVAIIYTAVCVAIECILNYGGQLIWEYPFWNRSFAGVWLIFFIGYFIFFLGALIIISLKSMKRKLIMLGIIYAVPIAMNIIAGIMGWVY